MDLQFPHHENEIAQSEGATGETFVNIWMHNGFVRVDEEKMSKSLGNFFTVREILARYRPEVVRFFILNSHYRSPLNYSDENLDEAQSALTRLYTALRGLPKESNQDSSLIDPYFERFKTAMNDDFNTAEAIAVLFDLAREVNKVKSESLDKAQQMAAGLGKMGAVLGLLEMDPDEFLQAGGCDVEGSGLRSEEIEALITERLKARSEKNWGEADRIRNILAEAGVVLEDTGGKTTWRRS